MKILRLSWFSRILLSGLFLVSIALQAIQPAAAQDRAGVRIARNAQTGKLSFIGAPAGKPIRVLGAQAPGLAASDRAISMVEAYAADFGLKQANRELKLTKAEKANGRQTTKFQQVYQDVPVMAGELVVNSTDQGDLLSINGEVSPDLSVDTAPGITAQQAEKTALRLTASSQRGGMPADFQASQPQLWIYDARLLHADGTAPSLVWRMDVTSKDGSAALRELVLIDAHSGAVLLYFNQVDQEWQASPATARLIDSSAPASGHDSRPLATASPDIRTYTMNHSTSVGSLPGTFKCSLANYNCTNGADPDADHAELYAYDTYQFYQSHFNRNSINNAGMPIISSVHYGPVTYQNAFWSGAQMVYGEGFSTALDVVGHELTHGVTQYSSNLFYYYQSGAINESLSDVFGELIQHAYQGTGDSWLLGENLSIGAIRSMSDPTLYSDPDKMSSPYYSFDPNEYDNGGVHSNSGINNKAAYLMAAGDSFNGYTVTPIGEAKTAAIYYEVNTRLLTSGSDYADLYEDLYQACVNLAAAGTAGITLADCPSVQNAVDAVEMGSQPTPPSNPEAPVCSAGFLPVDQFSDGFESGTGKWTLSSNTAPRWQLDSSVYGVFAHAGSHSLYADLSGNQPTDASAAMASGVVLPANAYLWFAQAYDFEHYPGDVPPNWYDGGVLEYSANGGPWADAGSLIQYNGYGSGSIVGGFDNPLAGRPGFVGASQGYISTRLDLSSLAGQSVRFRWRLGLDNFDWSSMTSYPTPGWWLDDVRIYTCQPASASVTVAIAGVPVHTYSLAASQSLPAAYGSVQNGPVRVTGSVPMLTSERGFFGPYQTFNEVLGFPTNQLTDHYWFPWYDNKDMITWVLVGNPSPTDTVHVTIKIAGAVVGTYDIPPFGRVTPTFGTLQNGPVEVFSDLSKPIFTSERTLLGYPGGAQSFNEVLGYPNNQLTNHYWFPWYDNKDMMTWVLVGNPDPTLTAHVTIKIAGTSYGPYDIGPMGRITPTFGTLQNGPVEVTSDINVFTSERSLFGASPYWTFNEVMGYPDNQLTNDYYFPWYDNTGMITWVLVGNPSPTLTAHVTIKIGGVVQQTMDVAPSGRWTPTFSIAPSGPVEVVSDNPVFSSERVLQGYPARGTSFNEYMGVARNKLTNDYWFTWYDNKDMRTSLVIANP